MSKINVRGASKDFFKKLHKIDRQQRKNKIMAIVPKYTQVLFISSVMCQNCNSTLTPNNAMACVSPDDLVSLAEKIHSDTIKQKMLICANPNLIIMFSPAFVLSDTLKAMASPIIKVKENGNNLN